jgi:hypothetical protein
MRVFFFSSLSLLAASTALAAPPQPTKQAAVAPRKPPTRALAPPVASAPAPDVKLTLDATTTRGPWAMRVTNDGDVPVRIVADARTLWLEVTPRSARKPVRCELPEDMRPADDLQEPLVQPPQRSNVETFEPRIYCFGTKLDALASGATVVAHLGWSGPAHKAPFEVSPIDGVEPELAPLKSIASAPIALPDEPTAEPAPASSAPGGDPYPPKLTLTGASAIDAGSPNGLEIPITLHNQGTRSVIVRFRPETLAFEVIGASGVENCAWPTLPSSPTHELFEIIPPRASASLQVLLTAYCSGHALDQGGLVVVRPRVDTRNASGASVGLRTFDGEVIATKPTIVRLHHGLVTPPLRRPRLEPEPGETAPTASAPAASAPAASAPAKAPPAP